MPPILTRYLLGDLLRSLLVTAGVLVTVMAFGASIKPLADNTLLTAGQTLKYILLATVPMMQFAIPFAAGFAATITLHRLTADNEIVAMCAGGISYRRILMPVAMLGAALTLIMLVLTQAIIPRFWGVLERTAAADITTLIQSSIARGEAFALDDNLLIYADDLFIRQNPEGTDADTRLVLVHVAVAELDDTGAVQAHITAEQAVADLLRTDTGLVISLALSEAVHYDAAGQLVRLGEAVLEPIEARSAVKDNPMAMTRSALIRIRNNPDLAYDVREASRELISAIQTETALLHLDETLRKHGHAMLRDADDADLQYELIADRLRGSRAVASGGEAVSLTMIRAGQSVRRLEPDRLLLNRAPSILDDAPVYELALSGVQATDLLTGATNRRAELPIRNVSIPLESADDLRGLTSEQLIERAQALPRTGRQIERLIAKIIRERDDNAYEATSRLQQRYAISLTPLLLTLLGAVLAMWMREGLPLTIYLWAFLPAVANLIVISGGDQMYRDMLDHGLIVMWSGNALMIAIIAHAYIRLRKN